MNSRINCPHCQRSLTFPAKLAGRGGQCPHCSGKFRIPSSTGQRVGGEPSSIQAVGIPAPPINVPPVSAPPANVPPVDAPWMYMHSGKITGPVSPIQLSQLCQSGQIAVDCPVFHVPSGRWMQLNNIPGMFAPAYPPPHGAWGMAPPPPPQFQGGPPLHYRR